MKERDVIERLRANFVNGGIGDDAAIITPPGGDLLFASDAVVEGVHFRRESATLAQAVQKVITSNVSDIYAMGGEPHSILVTAGLPPGCGESEVNEIIGGAALACEFYGVELVGGDTVRCRGGYFFDVSIIGSVERGGAVRRSGARPGDAIAVFGECGGSLAGMMFLEALFSREEGKGSQDGSDRSAFKQSATLIEELAADDAAVWGVVQEIIPILNLSMERGDITRVCDERGLDRKVVPLLELVRRHLVPMARPLDRSLIDADRRTGAAPSVSAMIDISDGLARDLATLCTESGVGAVVEERSLPLHSALTEIFKRDAAENARDSERAGEAGATGQMGVSGEEKPIGVEGAAGEQAVPGGGGSAGAGGASDVEDEPTGGETAPSSNYLTEIALSSGEEYVMLATIRGLESDAAVPGGTVIGWIVDRREGISLVTTAGERRPMPKLGYEHSF